MNEKTLQRGAELLEQSAGTSMTRRRVVATGIKLGYAVPVVAASFSLTRSGALAGSVTLEAICQTTGLQFECTCEDNLSYHPITSGNDCGRCCSCNHDVAGQPDTCTGGSQPVVVGGVVTCSASSDGSTNCVPICTNPGAGDCGGVGGPSPA